MATQKYKLPVDVYETAVAYLLYVLVPAVSLEHLTITSKNDYTLEIITDATSRQPVNSNKPDSLPLSTEIQWKPGYRRIILPQPVDMIRAEAVLADGFLTVTLPRL